MNHFISLGERAVWAAGTIPMSPVLHFHYSNLVDMLVLEQLVVTAAVK